MSTVSPAAVPAPAGGRPLRLSRMSDELLARYAARGSERAFSLLYERYSQPIYRYCRSIVRNEADAQDALQSSFTSALSALRRDARNAPLRPWLYRIAHNESISILRRRKRDVSADELPEPVVPGASAEEEAAGRARWDQLVRDLGDLPERQRAALLLRELAGLAHEEIAVALGLTVGGAKQAIFEARQGLTEVEEGRVMSCEDVRRRVSEGDRRVLRGRRVRSHLRECAACEAFALAIPTRRSELNALAPALPPVAAATVLGHVLTAASPQGGASAAAGSAAAAGAAGKVAGTAIAWKSVAGVAILATAAAGVNGLTHVLHHAHPAALRPPVKLGVPARTASSGVGRQVRAAAALTLHRAAAAPPTRTLPRHGAAANSAHAHPSAAKGQGRDSETGAVAHRPAAVSPGHGRAVGRSPSRTHQPAAAHSGSSAAPAHGRAHAQTQAQSPATASNRSPGTQHRRSVRLIPSHPNLKGLPPVSSVGTDSVTSGHAVKTPHRRSRVAPDVRVPGA